MWVDNVLSASLEIALIGTKSELRLRTSVLSFGHCVMQSSAIFQNLFSLYYVLLSGDKIKRTFLHATSSKRDYSSLNHFIV